MIRCEGSSIMIEGTSDTLLGELVAVMNVLLIKGIIDKDTLYECVEFASLSPDERRKQAEEAFTDMVCSVLGLPRMKPTQFDDMMKVVNKLMEERSDKDE